MRKLIMLFTFGALLSLAACGEDAKTVSAQAVSGFEASYDALTTAYIGAEHVKRLPDNVVASATQANLIVYPYVKSLRAAAEAGQSVSYLTFVAASTALVQLQAAMESGGIKVDLTKDVTDAAGTVPVTVSTTTIPTTSTTSK